MKKLCAVFFLSVLTIFAQNKLLSVSGHVYSNNDSQSLPGVNVYLSGTTLGAATNSKGYFKITNVPPGKYKLVFSMIGYKTLMTEIVVSYDLDIADKIILEEKIYNLNEIVVKSERPKEWFKNRDIFYRYFFGQTQLAHYCSIENSEYLNFKWVGSVLKAYSSKPLIILNNALGYKITCDLDTFNFDQSNYTISMHAGFLFKEMQPSNKEDSTFWLTNRQYTASTSLRHFFLWLLNKNISDGEYEISYGENPYFPKELNLFVDSKDEIADFDLASKGMRMKFRGVLNVKNNFHKFQSSIRLLKPDIYINKYGYTIMQNPYIVSGDWGLEGIANQLPMYDKLENKFQ